MKAEVRLVEGATMMAKGASGQWILMDPGVPSGGQGGAPSPMELVLIAYGGCIAMTATALLRKKAPGLEDLRVELEADLSESRPHVFTHITAKFIVHGKDLKEEDVEWAISRAHEKYCPVGAMLGKVIELDYKWEIN